MYDYEQRKEISAAYDNDKSTKLYIKTGVANGRTLRVRNLATDETGHIIRTFRQAVVLQFADRQQRIHFSYFFRSEETAIIAQYSMLILD